MAKLDLYEQEQVNKLKYFVHDYGKYILGVFVIVVIGYLANFFWQAHKEKQALTVASIYAQFTDKLSVTGLKSDDGLYQLVDKLQTSYPSFQDTIFATIEAGVRAHADGNLAMAERLLNWATSNASNKGLANVARLELVNVYIDGHKFEQALALLADAHNNGGAFDAAYYNSRGDLFLAQGKTQEAKEQYQAALRLLKNSDGIGQLLQVKLEVLGS